MGKAELKQGKACRDEDPQNDDHSEATSPEKTRIRSGHKQDDQGQEEEEEEEEWQAVLDESTNAYYFWNIHANEVSWEDPKLQQQQQQKPNGDGSGTASASKKNAASEGQNASAPATYDWSRRGPVELPSDAPNKETAQQSTEQVSAAAPIDAAHEAILSDLKNDALFAADPAQPPPYPTTSDPSDPVYQAYYAWYLAQSASAATASAAEESPYDASSSAWPHAGRQTYDDLATFDARTSKYVPREKRQNPDMLLQRQAHKQMGAYFNVEQYQADRNAEIAAPGGKVPVKFTKKEIQMLRKRKEEQKQKRKNAWLFAD